MLAEIWIDHAVRHEVKWVFGTVGILTLFFSHQGWHGDLVTNLFHSCVGVVSQCFPFTMDGSFASAQQPHQLPDSVAGIAHDPATSAQTQRVPDLPAAVEPEESSPKPELSSSEVVPKTADILQMLQKLQAQQSVTPPTPQTASFTPKPEPQPQPVPVIPEEEPQSQPQPITTAVQEEPSSEWDAIRTSLRENTHDIEGWNKLVLMAEDSSDLEKIKDAYESLLKMYPNTVRNLQSVVNYVLLT